MSGLPPRKRPSAREISEARRKQRWHVVNYESILDHVTSEIIRYGFFDRLAEKLPFWGFVLLKDVLNNWLCLDNLDKLSREAQKGNGEAKKVLSAILSSFFKTPILGTPTRFTKEESKEKKKARDRTAKQDTRAVEYYDQAWQQYRERTKNVTEPALLWKKANNIIEEEFSRKTEAKTVAKQSFKKQVANDIARRTVAKKSR